MSDNLQNDNVIIEQRKPPDTTMPMVVYALYLASFVVSFTSVIGVVIAYVYRGKGPEWLDEHYRYQIRTFWIGLLYASVATLLTVWLIVRCVKGFRGLQEKRAPDNVGTWLF